MSRRPLVPAVHNAAISVARGPRCHWRHHTCRVSRQIKIITVRPLQRCRIDAQGNLEAVLRIVILLQSNLRQPQFHPRQNQVRILLASPAASEPLNLHTVCLSSQCAPAQSSRSSSTLLSSSPRHPSSRAVGPSAELAAAAVHRSAEQGSRQKMQQQTQNCKWISSGPRDISS